MLNSIETQTTEAKGIFSDTANGFRSHINLYDNLSTHIMMYDDATLLKKNIYTTYSDFKGAFNKHGPPHLIPDYERLRAPRLVYRHLQTPILRL